MKILHGRGATSLQWCYFMAVVLLHGRVATSLQSCYIMAVVLHHGSGATSLQWCYFTAVVLHHYSGATSLQWRYIIAELLRQTSCADKTSLLLLILYNSFAIVSTSLCCNSRHCLVYNVLASTCTDGIGGYCNICCPIPYG